MLIELVKKGFIMAEQLQDSTEPGEREKWAPVGHFQNTRDYYIPPVDYYRL